MSLMTKNKTNIDGDCMQWKCSHKRAAFFQFLFLSVGKKQKYILVV